MGIYRGVLASLGITTVLPLLGEREASVLLLFYTFSQETGNMRKHQKDTRMVNDFVRSARFDRFGYSRLFWVIPVMQEEPATFINF